MPASAATARTVSPPGPVRIRTASAAASSSRSTSADGVRARRAATSPALLMQTIFSYPASSPARLTDYRTMFHSYITTYYINAEEPGPMETTHTRNGRRWWILAVLCLSVLPVVVDNTIVNVALPTISRDLSASTQALQWVVDAYTLVFAGLLLLAGNLGDRLGRRRTLQIGLAAFGLFSVGAALAQNTGELIAARAAMGAAAALVYPATLAILNNVFTVPRQRGRVDER